MARYQIAPQCDGQNWRCILRGSSTQDNKHSAQIEMALPVDEFLVGLRNKFTIREHRARPQFEASFHLLLGLLFPKARDLSPRSSKKLGAIF